MYVAPAGAELAVGRHAEPVIAVERFAAERLELFQRLAVIAVGRLTFRRLAVIAIERLAVGGVAVERDAA